MTSIWVKVAKNWCRNRPIIDKLKMDKKIDAHLDQVKKEISNNNVIPSVLEAIKQMADDDDDDY